jgi:hypothetical protein
MFEWFLDQQLKIALFIGSLCVSLVFVFDSRGVQTFVSFLISLVFIFIGSKLYANDTSENWIKFSISDSIRKMFGGALMLIGWIIFLRAVLALAIASSFLKTS